MSPAEKLFNFVCDNHPWVWEQIIARLKPYGIQSLVYVLDQHLRELPLTIFNQNLDKIPGFLLDFCTAVMRNAPCPGDPYGINLTCRCTQLFTQEALDTRHLRLESNPDDREYNVTAELRFEIEFFTQLRQAFEVTNKKRWTTVFVRGQRPQHLQNSCTLDTKNPAYSGIDDDGSRVSLSLKSFVVADAFVPGFFRVMCLPAHINHVLENVRDTYAFTDVKRVARKLGNACYLMNVDKVLRLQFFKNAEPDPRNDVFNIVRFQCCDGEPLPLNRTGLRKNSNRSALEKLCFEAVKQIYIAESMRAPTYEVRDSTSKIYFGQQFNEGTGSVHLVHGYTSGNSKRSGR